ncbi:YqgE/AlgH family protein [Cognatishimia sp.]|uniref:YqgE/AlgH family protein n=1 Tax=Cognatishimia sp. TaxID=2211648 RepID=UPI0035177C2F
MAIDQYSDLTGRLLIAMPSMADPRFSHSVVFICAHNKDGAMGLIVNKFLGFMKLSEILDSDESSEEPNNHRLPLHFGGPVERKRGFVLHSSDYCAEDVTLKVTDAFSMTASLHVLEEINQGKGPELALLAMGYSGWGPGQLEEEILDNSWLVADPTSSLMFVEEDDQKWAQALKQLGVDPHMLSGSAGRA